MLQPHIAGVRTREASRRPTFSETTHLSEVHSGSRFWNLGPNKNVPEIRRSPVTDQWGMGENF